MKRLLTVVSLILISNLPAFVASAQDEARASWQLQSFDIAVSVLQSERALSGTCTLSIKNSGRGMGTQLILRMNSKAVVSAITANSAGATFRSLPPEPKLNIQRIIVTLPSSVPPASVVSLAVTYRLPVESNTGLEAISPIGTQFLPLSFWYPVLNTALTVRGADTGAFKLKIDGGNALSSGNSSGQTFDQPLSGQPFFLLGEWDQAQGTSADAKGVSAYLAKGADADERKQADAMITTAAGARAFYASLLGPAPDAPIRLISVRRGSGFSDNGTILIEAGAFRRAKLDAAAAMLIAESVARIWIGGQSQIRGEGSPMLRDSLTRYFATLFIEKQFGHDAAEAELARQRTAFAGASKRDAPISRLTPLDDTYYNSAPNKGAMVWRLVERRLGREAFLAAVKSLLQTDRSDPNSIGLATFRTELARTGGEELKLLLDQELDQPTDLDLMVGLPHQLNNDWVAALRNFGSIDATVTVVGITDRGEQLKVQASVPAHNFGEAIFKTSSKLVRAEIDPDKLYPQIDYGNDMAPPVRSISEAFATATGAMGAQDYVKADAAAREILNQAPRMQEARILLGRALLGQSKLDEAEKLFRSALDDALPTANTLAWASIGLGEIALRRGQSQEAVRRFNEGVRVEGEYGSQLAGRAGRVKAEVGTGGSPIDDSGRAFISQLDQAIVSGRKAELDTKVVSGELVRFVNSLIGTQPEIWQTKVLRTEQWSGNLLLADVYVKAKELGREQEGTAVLVLARVGGAWKLTGVEYFEVR